MKCFIFITVLKAYFSTIFKWKALSIILYLVIFRSTFKKEGAICNSVVRFPLGSRGKLGGVAECRAAGRGLLRFPGSVQLVKQLPRRVLGFERLGPLVAHINRVTGRVSPYGVKAGILPGRLWF